MKYLVTWAIMAATVVAVVYLGYYLFGRYLVQ